MSTFHSRTTTTRDDWQTPLEIVQALGTFDLDPCANVLDPTRCARVGFTEFDDGLSLEWTISSRVFLNPPYGNEAKKWIARLVQHGNGIALIPPRMGSSWFHRLVLETADAILFLEGRVDFIDPRTGNLASRSINPVTGKPFGGSNMDTCLIAWGKLNVHALRACGLRGVLWEI